MAERTDNPEAQEATMAEHESLMTVGDMESLALMREPDVVIGDAKKVAKALMGVVSQKPKQLIFNDKQYLEVDDWQVIGAFHGCAGEIEWTRPIHLESTGANGWEAAAILKDRHGRVLSRAEAMCLDDEEKWSARPKYEWHYVTRDGRVTADDPGPDNIVWEPNPFKEGKKRPQRQRVLVGTDPVPSFQLRSMAQTRALSKVHANVFRWVATLAGYQGTPAEELDVEERAKDAGVVDGQVVNESTSQTSHTRTTTPTDAALPLDDERGAPSPGSAPAANGSSNGNHGTAQQHGAAGPVILVANIKERSGRTNGKDWRLWSIKFSNGHDGSTFDSKIAELATECAQHGTPVTYMREPGKKPGTFNITELAVSR